MACIKRSIYTIDNLFLVILYYLLIHSLFLHDNIFMYLAVHVCMSTPLHAISPILDLHVIYDPVEIKPAHAQYRLLCLSCRMQREPKQFTRILFLTFN